jgi:two-component system CheB/CheR fusion protein
MSDTALLADHIDQQIDAILSVWKATVERFGNVPDSERLTYREFVDHIPELLERLALRLRGQDADAAEAAQKHGQHRWSQGYDIAEVVSELGHLRSTLIRDFFVFAKEHNYTLSRVESITEAINQVIDDATTESVRQFDEDARALNQSMLSATEDRKRIAEREQIKLQTLLNKLPVGVWVCQADGFLIHVNREAERLQGFSESETVGRVNILEGIPEYRLFRTDGTPYEFADLPLSRALRGESITQEDCIWPTRLGTLVITNTAAPLTTADGQTLGAVVVSQDITERKRLEVELAISEARFRGIVAKSPVMIWRADVTGDRDFFNETWLDFRGRTEHEEWVEGWAEGVHDEDRSRCLEIYRQSFQSREPFEMVYRLLHRDGQYRWVTDRGSPYQDAKDVFLGYLGSCMDITTRVELEAKLEQQSQHKSRLMAALSHDARTPLNAVVLSAKLLESQAKDQDDPEVRECLTTIRNAVRNVLDLLSDLLDLSRIDAGATRAEVSRFALQETLAECLSSVEPQARDKGLDIRLEVGELAPVGLETDRAKLKQILSNLLSNALRYTEKGGIRLFAERDRRTIRIGVEDTGVGIAEPDQSRIFDEFAVLEHPNRPRGEGTGLGLAICRRLANLLHGEILLESELGRGSTFTLVLPSSILTSAPVDDRPRLANPIRDFSGAILIAEDHADSRKTLAKVLRRMGYRVIEAEDGREVLELVRNERPMVVLMDVNMPGMDGVETTLALRRDPDFLELPIFALTGDVSIVNQQRIGEAGVDGYLEKPVTWEKLEAALAKLRDRG